MAATYIEELKSLARQRFVSGDRKAARDILEHCLKICHAEIENHPGDKSQALRENVLIEYGSLLNLIDLKAALEVWEAVRKRSQDLLIKVNAVCHEFDVLCKLQLWKKAKAVSHVATQALQEFLLVHGYNKMFFDLDLKVKRLTALTDLKLEEQKANQACAPAPNSQGSNEQENVKKEMVVTRNECSQRKPTPTTGPSVSQLPLPDQKFDTSHNQASNSQLPLSDAKLDTSHNKASNLQLPLSDEKRDASQSETSNSQLPLSDAKLDTSCNEASLPDGRCDTSQSETSNSQLPLSDAKLDTSCNEASLQDGRCDTSQSETSNSQSPLSDGRFNTSHDEAKVQSPLPDVKLETFHNEASNSQSPFPDGRFDKPHSLDSSLMSSVPEKGLNASCNKASMSQSSASDSSCYDTANSSSDDADNTASDAALRVTEPSATKKNMRRKKKQTVKVKNEDTTMSGSDAEESVEASQSVAKFNDDHQKFNDAIKCSKSSSSDTNSAYDDVAGLFQKDAESSSTDDLRGPPADTNHSRGVPDGSDSCKTRKKQKVKKKATKNDDSIDRRVSELSGSQCNNTNGASAEEGSTTDTSAGNVFPLASTHDFILGCQKCSSMVDSATQKWVRFDHTGCERNILLVRRKKDGLWTHIKNRPQKAIYQTHRMCWMLPNSLCVKNPQVCQFAHSEEELNIWNVEKFDIEAFKLENRQSLPSNNVVTSMNPAGNTENPGIRYPSGTKKKNKLPKLAAKSQKFTPEASSSNTASTFPLEKTHNFMFGCLLCASENNNKWTIDTAHPGCAKTHLLVRPKKDSKSSWVRIRNRPPLEFYGRYRMCEIFPHPLRAKDELETCYFAHSKAEKDIWNAEKFGDFSLEAFKVVNRGEVSESASSSTTPCDKTFPLGATHDMRLGCSACVTEVNDKWKILERHAGCAMDCLFVRKKADSQGLWMKIRNRQLKVCSKTYRLCWNFPNKPCHKHNRETCYFAHSEEEKQMWNAEKFHGFNIETFKVQSRSRLSQKGNTSKPSIDASQDIAKQIATFIDRYPGLFIFTREVVLYKFGDTDIRIHKPQNATRKTELCQDTSFCLKTNCLFAHSEVERDFWLLAVETNMRVETLCKRLNDSNSSTAQVLPNDPLETLYCNFCNVQCNGPRQFEIHCNSKPHMDKLTADSADQWQHRQPPPGVLLKLCDRHIIGTCQYSNAPPEFNFCVRAHSQDELEEWILRGDLCHHKKRFARQKGLLSYVTKLEQQLEECTSVSELMKDQLKNVRVKVEKDLRIFLKEKSDEVTWTFNIRVKDLTLQNVALLKKKDRFWFELDHLGREHVQHLNVDDVKGHVVPSKKIGNYSYYQVTVRFRGGAFGSFRQWLVLDFGEPPYIVKRLEVDVGEKIHEKMEVIRHSMETDRWTTENRNIIPFDNEQVVKTTNDAFMNNLHRKYRLRQGEVSSCIMSDFLSKDNYVTKMHDLLYMEETCQLQMISRFTSKLMTRVSPQATLPDGTLIFAPAGIKFAKLTLKNILSSEGRAGYLIQRSCTKVLLRLKKPSGKYTSKAYEAPLVTKGTMFGVNSLGHDHVFACVGECFLNAANIGDEETDIEVWVQFEMNRSPFCAMHHAIDQMSANLDILFPKSSRSIERKKYDVKTNKLNTRQLTAMNRIMNHQRGDPMLVVHGAFGTGKTMTLSYTAMHLMKSEGFDKKGKILICTLSNSAADLFVNLLDELNDKEKKKFKMLRVFQKDRHMKTISPSVRKYMLTERDNFGNLHVGLPTSENIENANVVITTVYTCLELVKLEISGTFCHIFIDEAGQTFEPQLLMPLLLATKDTCIVLAGDVMQMSPQVYSDHAEELKISLLQRIYEGYQTEQKFIGNQQGPRHSVYLNENYRNDQLILKFLAEVIYGNENMLLWRSGIKTDQASLRLHVVHGEEKPGTGTSFYNEQEVHEIGHLLINLVQQGSDSFRPKDLSKIVVTSVYTDQVELIRKHLRTIRLGAVAVLQMENLQGCQYDVVVISTVHTSNPIHESTADNLGFLSDTKLINTAISRAKYRAIIVGDAEALCTRGTNTLLWYTFISLALARNGLVVANHDPGDFVKHIEEKMMEFNALSTTSSNREVVGSGGNVVNGSGAAESDNEEDSMSEEADSDEESGGDESPEEDEESEDDSEISDSRLKEAQESIERILKAFREGTGEEMLVPFLRDVASNEFIPESNVERITGVKVLRCLTYDENEGIAKLEIPTQDRSGKKKGTKWKPLPVEFETPPNFRRHRQTSAADNECEQVNPDEFVDENDIMEMMYMKGKLASDVDCKRCKLIGRSSNKISAVILEDRYMEGKSVHIRCRRHCKRGLDGDEVVVQLKRLNGKYIEPLQGIVLGVIRRSMEMRFRTFVCRVDAKNPYLMFPLNTKMPPMVNLRRKREDEEIQRKRDGEEIPIYKMSQGRTPMIQYNHKINDHGPVVYIVMYLKWTMNNSLPLGMVIGTLPIGNDMQSGYNILVYAHNVPRTISECLEKTCAQNFPSNYMDKKEFPYRVDLRDKRIFTVDDDGSEDLDDALHIEKNQDGSFTVGVHIADVSHFVKPDTPIDREAFKRGTSYYPICQPVIHMLPKCLATDLCSLLPGKDRLAVSVLFTILPNGRIKAVRRCLAIIRSRRRFNYKEVEDILDNTGQQNEEWRSDIQTLYAFAMVISLRYKGDPGWLGLDDEADPKAHMMVAEWMVMTNQHIAEYLVQKFPEKVPLCKQIAPTQEDLDDWKKKFDRHVPFSFYLLHIANLLQQEQTPEVPGGSVQVFCNTWHKLRRHYNEGQTLDKITRSVDCSPNHFCALKSWHAIQNKMAYECSGYGTNHMYFSLASRAYTHFTSPIRRYADVIVHRLLKADIDRKDVHYTKDDISEICTHCNATQRQSGDFKNETKLLKTAGDLKESPSEAFVVVKNVGTSKIEVLFPTIKHMPSRLRRIPYAWLDMKEDPSFEDDGKITMKFEKRIYKYGIADPCPGDGTHLDSKEFTVAVPNVLWKSLMDYIAHGNEEMALETFTRIRAAVEEFQFSLAREISSERAVQRKKQQQITFTRDMEIGDVLRVQLATRIDHGMIRPCVQLIKLTKSFHICLEHAHDPVNSFSSKRICGKRNDNISQYRKFWLSLLTMESAYSVVKNPGDQAHVYNVPAEWRKCNDGVVHGRLKMSKSFCQDRFLLLSYDVLFKPEKEEDGSQNWFEDLHDQAPGIGCRKWQVTKYGFMCVKFTFNVRDKDLTWVGHFHITDVLMEKDVVVILKLNQSCYEFPAAALDKSDSDTPRCTIHWLDKPVPDIRAESAVLQLQKWGLNSLPVLISQRQIAPGNEYLPEDIHINSSVLVAPNEEQAIAVRAALHKNNKFVVIWGPPGTGKSVTGVRLAYLFAKSNESDQLVLYCGPSNKSVNVVTAKLKQLNIKVVRIFSEMLVHHYYPLPNFPQTKVVDNETVDDHKDVALHELIRLKGRRNAAKITQYDKQFKEAPQSATLKDIIDYKKLVSEACIEELSMAEVILCTSGSSGNGLYKKLFPDKVQQVIIDESGMCKEPETLIPIVACNPKKVVLIGDHKQLRPVINCPQAKDAGLDKTLFEEYADETKAYANKVVMLKTQYRMHEYIQDFPSRKFYHGMLRCGLPDVQTGRVRPYENFWPAGCKRPIAFCHVEGEATMQSVTTTTAGVNSVCNVAEVNQVIRVVHALVGGGVDAKKIAVLTPYRLQQMKLKETLQREKLQTVTVSTITNSQGNEWPYVILSTVRSLPIEDIRENPWSSWCLENLGFLTDPHQVNVALTRAKNGLVIIGNKNLLKCDTLWEKLLDFYQEHRAITNVNDFP